MQNNKQTNKPNAKKYLVMLGVFVIALIISIITSGFQTTLYKFIELIVFAILGFILFYVVYFTAYFITKQVYSRNRKTYVKTQISTNADIERLVNNPKYSFKYQRKQSLTENVQTLIKTISVAVSDVSEGFEKGGKYYYLNYTVFDAIAVLQETINLADEKFGGVLKKFKFYDKPIGFIESKLTELVEGEEPKKSSPIIGGLIKAGAFVFANQLTSACNDFIAYVISEAYSVYGKDKQSFDFTKVEVEDERVA